MTGENNTDADGIRWSLILRAGLLAIAAVLTVGLVAACGDDDDESDNGNTDDPPTEVVRPAADTLFFQLDTVRGPTNTPDEKRADLVCIQLSRFPQGTEIVWRFKIFDPSTGESLDDTQMETVEVILPTGEVLETRWDDHPRDNPTDQFWTASWDIPLDYPTGTFAYQVRAVSKDGLVGEYKQLNVAPALTTIVPMDDTVVPEEGDS